MSESIFINCEETKESLLEDFKEMFKISNIQKGKSNEVLSRFGGSEGFLSLLNVDFKSGLDSHNKEDLKHREAKWGNNKFTETEEKGFFYFVLESMQDKILKILTLAGIVSLILGVCREGVRTGWMEGLAILMAVAVVVLVTSLNNWNKEKQFSKLNKENRKKQVTVRRDGVKCQEISSEDILVGDILHLKIGDILSVDGLVLSGALGVDESPMTGESDIIKKSPSIHNDSSPFLISGTMVREGSGEMIACAVGRHTQTAVSRDALVAVDEKTPLQKKLDVIATKIGDFGIIAAVFIGTITIVKEFLFRLATERTLFDASMLDVVINAVTISITVIVVAIPEGLPMAVTLSLAYSVIKMKDENNLVRHIDASETMGNVNNICVDKTGTLTKGEMFVKSLLVYGRDYKAEDLSDKSVINDKIVAAIVNNVSSWVEFDGIKTRPRGNVTESALLLFLIKLKVDIEKYKNPQQTVDFLPFSSEYKMMASVYKKDDSTYTVLVKGASEIVFKRCSEFLNENNKFDKISEQFTHTFHSKLDEYAENAERTLTIAFRSISVDDYHRARQSHPHQDFEFFDEICRDLKLLCLIGISDIPRKEVKEAIRQCQASGITVRMITGDNIKTAMAIAKEVGIITDKEYTAAMGRIKGKQSETPTETVKITNATNNVDQFIHHEKEREKLVALEGEEFKALSGGYSVTTTRSGKKTNIKFDLTNRKNFLNTVKDLKVVARASPDDKFLLVLGLKELGNIVAVTGDGTNDAPALKHSHVGFSMGKKGTDIAKEASDIVLLDDSFTSIVTAIKYGRNVYDSIRKFLQFQLTTNIVAVFMTLVGGIMLKDSPLNPIQMLWVNLIMDSFASLALATEPPSDELLKRRPYEMKEPIVTHMMNINIVSQAVFQIVVLQTVLFYGDVIFSVASDRDLGHSEWNKLHGYHFTLFFNVFVLLQVFNSINARKLNKSEWNVFKNILNNYTYIAVQSFIVVMQILIVQFGGRALRTQPLTLYQHLACVLIASSSLLFAFGVKLIPFEDYEDGRFVVKPLELRGGSRTRSRLKLKST